MVSGGQGTVLVASWELRIHGCFRKCQKAPRSCQRSSVALIRISKSWSCGIDPAAYACAGGERLLVMTVITGESETLRLVLFWNTVFSLRRDFLMFALLLVFLFPFFVCRSVWSLQLDSQFLKGSDYSKEFFVLPASHTSLLDPQRRILVSSPSTALEPRLGQAWHRAPEEKKSSSLPKTYPRKVQLSWYLDK